MNFIIKLIISTFLLMISTTTFANWKVLLDSRSTSEVYSQTKYFSFYSENLSGHIAYIQLSPLLIKKFYVMANVVVGSKQFTMFHPYDSDCVDRSQLNTMVDVCGSAGILHENSEGMTLVNKIGKIQWNLRVDKSALFDHLTRYDLAFDKSNAFEKIFNFDWSISWKPMDLSMSTSGQIFVDGRKIEVNKLTTYHDDTWGNWNFLTQPYFWLFMPIDHSEKNIKLVIGDIYFNKPDRLMGLSITIDREVVRYLPNQYVVSFLQRKTAGSIPLKLLDNEESFTESTMMSLSQMPNSHSYPSRVLIYTLDGKVRIDAKVRSITPYTVELPLGTQHIYSDNWNDDMVVDLNYQIQGLSGMNLRGHSVGGMEFFQNKKIGFPERLTPN